MKRLILSTLILATTAQLAAADDQSRPMRAEPQSLTAQIDGFASAGGLGSTRR